MNDQFFKKMSIPAIFVFLFTTACVPAKKVDSQKNAVALPLTSIEDQGSMGFCWSYALTALVESLYFLRTGNSINLSEEALGYYHLGTSVSHIVRKSSNLDELKSRSASDLVAGQFLANNALRLSPALSRLPSQQGAITLASMAAWPEEIYKVKFPSGFVDESVLAQSGMDASRKVNAGTLALQNIRERLIALASEKNGLEEIKSLPVQKLAEKVLVQESAQSTAFGFPSAPPEQFMYQGSQFTPDSFLSDFLGVNVSNFVYLTAGDLDLLSSFIIMVRYSLATGRPVPMTFPVNHHKNLNSAFLGSNANPAAKNAFNGGHAVLVTDFSNVGEKNGEILDKQELCAALTTPVEEFSHFTVKNSWGMGQSKSESGQATQSGNGFYKIDFEYMKQALQQGKSIGFMLPIKMDGVESFAPVQSATPMRQKLIQNVEHIQKNCASVVLSMAKAHAAKSPDPGAKLL